MDFEHQFKVTEMSTSRTFLKLSLNFTSWYIQQERLRVMSKNPQTLSWANATSHRRWKSGLKVMSSEDKDIARFLAITRIIHSELGKGREPISYADNWACSKLELPRKENQAKYTSTLSHSPFLNPVWRFVTRTELTVDAFLPE